MKRIRIAIIGGYTIDEIHENSIVYERPGGAPIFSSYGVFKAGGIPEVFSIKGKDFTFNIPDFIIEKFIQNVDYNIRFKIILNNDYRKIFLIRKNDEIHFDYGILNDYTGMIINPVCKEVPNNIKINLPIALDLQGFIRNCNENEEIKLENANLYTNENYMVFHANDEELEKSGLNIEKLYTLGFKEILISHGSKGFTLYHDNKSTDYEPSIVGNYEIGNGDFLLGYYFTLRLLGNNIKESAEKSLLASEEFSMYGLNLRIPQY